MIDATLWAKRLLAEYREAVKDPDQIETAFIRRAAKVVRDAQVDATSECLLKAQLLMDGVAARHKPALGRVVDTLSDLTLDVRTGHYPTLGGR
jgi:uncharacterized membrane-anchored protein